MSDGKSWTLWSVWKWSGGMLIVFTWSAILIQDWTSSSRFDWASLSLATWSGIAGVIWLIGTVVALWIRVSTSASGIVQCAAATTSEMIGFTARWAMALFRRRTILLTTSSLADTGKDSLLSTKIELVLLPKPNNNE